VPQLLGSWRYRKKALAIAGALVLSLLSICTRRQVSHWQDGLTLWEHALAVSPDSSRLHHLVATLLSSHNQHDNALTHYRRALQINPDSAETICDYGYTLEQLGKVDQAVAHYRRALELAPDYFYGHYNLAQVLAQQEKYDDAIEHFQRALRARPNWHRIDYHLGNIYFNRQSFDLAVTHWTKVVGAWTKVVQSNPDDHETLNNLAWLLATCPDASIRDPAAAVNFAQRSCELTNYERPANLHTLAIAYAAAGRLDQAIATAQRATALATDGEPSERIRQIQDRLQLLRTGPPYRQPSSPP